MFDLESLNAPALTGPADQLEGLDILGRLTGPPVPVDQPTRPRPPGRTLLERKRASQKYWRPLHQRMLEDERLYKMQHRVPKTRGQKIGDAEQVILNDLYVLVEKAANMVGGQEPVILSIPQDPRLKELGQKVRDFCAWWREEADQRWTSNLHSYLSREEVYFLALRGWLSGRIMLDPGDPDWPYRYDLVDPVHVFPQPGDKRIRWVFHIYKDTKRNVLNNFGWDQGLLDRIESKIGALEDEAEVEIASFYDDCYHVLFIDEAEVWSAAHNYGFVPWEVAIAFGPPTRKTDPLPVSYESTPEGWAYTREDNEWVRWWGVSIFQGVKGIHKHMNRLASAVLTEAMKAPNPPVAIYTDQKGMAEGKEIDTAAGATNYLLWNKEKLQLVESGFKPSELAPLLQILQGARDRGTLPGVMYGEGASFLSGFAVSLLTSGARDILLPLVRAHERYLTNLFRHMLQLTAEVYRRPVSMVATDPSTDTRELSTHILPDEIKQVGYQIRVYYRNVTPQDQQMLAAVANQLVQGDVISRETARGDKFLGLPNPLLENKRILSEKAYLDPEVIQAAIPKVTLETDPSLYFMVMQARMEAMQQQMQQLQMMMMGGPPGGGPPGSPKPPGLPGNALPLQRSAAGPPPKPHKAGLIQSMAA